MDERKNTYKDHKELAIKEKCLKLITTQVTVQNSRMYDWVKKKYK